MDETDAALAAFGLKREGDSQSESGIVEIWSVNFKTVQLFKAMRTQWRVGPNGASGLDYAVLPIVAKPLQIKLTQERLDDLQVMELETLSLIHAEG